MRRRLQTRSTAHIASSLHTIVAHKHYIRASLFACASLQHDGGPRGLPDFILGRLASPDSYRLGSKGGAQQPRRGRAQSVQTQRPSSSIEGDTLNWHCPSKVATMRRRRRTVVEACVTTSIIRQTSSNQHTRPYVPSPQARDRLVEDCVFC